MPRRRSPSTVHVQTVLTYYDEVDRELNVKVDVTYHKGSDAYFSKSFGNYLPGDPPEMDIDILGHEAEAGMDPELVKQILNDTAGMEEKILSEGHLDQEDDGY